MSQTGQEALEQGGTLVQEQSIIKARKAESHPHQKQSVSSRAGSQKPLT